MSIKKLLRNQKGFSLIELLIVIGIMAILAVIIIPRFTDTSDQSREVADSSNAKLLQSAVERYHFDKGLYPVGTAGSATISSETNINQQLLIDDKYISEKAVDPWKKSREYRISAGGVVQLLGKPS